MMFPDGFVIYAVVCFVLSAAGFAYLLRHKEYR